MAVARTKAELLRLKRSEERTAFVPTMGALHEGHLALAALAKTKAPRVVVSIFVNPTQFAPNEDFESYPRDLEGDLKKLEAAGVDLVYTPGLEDIYPAGPCVSLKAGKEATGLESDFRPHFFDGVVTVVSRLFEQIRPDLAIFGEKDYQQMMVVREMVRNLGLPIEIVAAPIVRDDYGLALSSRNAYLNDAQLITARCLNKILLVPPENPEQALLAAGFEKVDYVARRWGRILAAAWIGKARLIDNMQSGR